MCPWLREGKVVVTWLRCCAVLALPFRGDVQIVLEERHYRLEVLWGIQTSPEVVIDDCFLNSPNRPAVACLTNRHARNSSLARIQVLLLNAFFSSGPSPLYVASSNPSFALSPLKIRLACSGWCVCACLFSSQPDLTYLHDINRRQSSAPQVPTGSPTHCRPLPSRE